MTDDIITISAGAPARDLTPGVHEVDAPALTNWKLGEVARSAVENAKPLIEDGEAGKTDAAVKYLTALVRVGDSGRPASRSRSTEPGSIAASASARWSMPAGVSATTPTSRGLGARLCLKTLQWRARQDSNLRPLGPEPNALSTELQARGPGMIPAGSSFAL